MVRAAAVNEWAELAVATYAALVHERIHFAQAAYRDGEWYCMAGHGGSNINGEQYTPELAEALRRTLLEPVGQWCVLWWAHPTIGARARRLADAWIAEHRPDVRWIPDRPIGRATELGLAAPFWRAARTRRVILVGPAALAAQELVPVAHHITVPDAVAWQHEARLSQQIRAVAEPDDLVLFAAGMASNLMIWRLWPEYRGTLTLLDIGASLDPYAGLYSRGVFRERGWRETVQPRNVP